MLVIIKIHPGRYNGHFLKKNRACHFLARRTAQYPPAFGVLIQSLVPNSKATKDQGLISEAVLAGLHASHARRRLPTGPLQRLPCGNEQCYKHEPAHPGTPLDTADAMVNLLGQSGVFFCRKQACFLPNRRTLISEVISTTEMPHRIGSIMPRPAPFIDWNTRKNH